MLVSICCIACDIGDQTWWLVKDWSQCLCLIFAGVWVMFQVHMMCSLSIINPSRRGRLYPLGMVAGVYVDTQGEWSSPKSRGDRWPEGIGDKGKGWSVVEAHSMRCCAPDLKAHWGSLQAWTHTQSKLEEGSKVSHLMILLLNDLCYSRPLQADHGVIQPKWREEESHSTS